MITVYQTMCKMIFILSMMKSDMYLLITYYLQKNIFIVVWRVEEKIISKAEKIGSIIPIIVSYLTL